MMRLNKLPKLTTTGKKRVGRGIGSGKGGHTIGRGSKGQKARGDIGPIFIGSKLRKSLVKRLPFLRGKGKLKSRQGKTLVIDLKSLTGLSSGETVDMQKLLDLKLIKSTDLRKKVKVLGVAELKNPFSLMLNCSGSVRKQVEAIGGSVGKLMEKPKTVIKKTQVKSGAKKIGKKE